MIRFAGRYIVLSFLGSTAQPSVAEVVSHITSRKNLFDDMHVCFFGVSIDPADEVLGRLKEITTGIRYLWDFDMQVSS